MSNPHTQADIEALADNLSACADALHTRLMRAIRQQAPGSSEPKITQAAAQALFDNEVTLRQRANSLYLDAATLAASGFGAAQQQMLDLTARAQDHIRKIDRLKDLVDITAELLALGAAVAAGKPEHIAAPLEKIKHHLATLNAPPP
ncbi:hypothetical protein [Duganella sp. LjRoot269]|jgi:hypothetical protein|uniref:hypothetical protein n=1 Tax=Duganella sp. LjRoot269 TaxID=3342305 RepID=UPI003ECDB669